MTNFFQFHDIPLPTPRRTLRKRIIHHRFIIHEDIIAGSKTIPHVRRACSKIISTKIILRVRRAGQEIFCGTLGWNFGSVCLKCRSKTTAV